MRQCFALILVLVGAASIPLNAASGVYAPGPNTLFYLPLDGPNAAAPEGCTITNPSLLSYIPDRFNNAASAIHVSATGSPSDSFYIGCSNSKIAGNTSNNFTVGYWIRMTTLPAGGNCANGCDYRNVTILASNSDNQGCRKYDVAEIGSGGGGAPDGCASGDGFSSTTQIVDGKWHNILWVVDHTNQALTLYVDGILSTRGSLPDPSYTAGNFQAIAGAENGSFALNGDMDDLWIENHAWTAVEVASYLISDRGKRVSGQITSGGNPAPNVYVVHLDSKLVRVSSTVTDANGDYFFSGFHNDDYIVPVSSGNPNESDTNPGIHGLLFTPPFCKIGDNLGRACTRETVDSVVEDFLATSKPGPLNPPFSFDFKLPLPGGGTWPSWTLITEAGGYAITGGVVDADPSHTDKSTGWYALDFGAPCGTPIVASAAGSVLFAATDNQHGWGKTVIIQHATSFLTRYAHLDSFAPKIKNGVSVSQGEVIGFVGSTGKSEGFHVHFQLYDATDRLQANLFPPVYSLSSDSQLRRALIDTGNHGSISMGEFLAGALYSSTNTSTESPSACQEK